MKKALSLLLVLAMMLGLCACDKSSTQSTTPNTSEQVTTDGTEPSADSTEKSDDGTTEATQPSTEGSTSAPTEDPTTTPTQVPSETPTTPPVTCIHNWVNATCTTPKTCSLCATTEGNAAGHSWSNATCTAPKTCTTCGETEGDALDHSFSNGNCSGCGKVEPSDSRVVSNDGLFSIVVPNSIKDDLGGMFYTGISFMIGGVTWQDVGFVIPVNFYAVNNAESENWNASVDTVNGDIKTILITSNDEHSILCEYLVHTDYIEGEAETIEQVQEILDNLEAMKASIQWE